MVRKTGFWVVSLLLVALLVQFAIAQDEGATVVVEPDGSVVLGVAAALSGEGLAPLGEDIVRGAELAVEDRPVVTVGDAEFAVSLDPQDDQCSAEGGQAVANLYASNPEIVGVVGPMCSSACRAAAPIFDEAGYTSISPSCTAADLTTSDFASFNRAVVSDAFQGVLAADFIFNTLGVTRIATIHDGSPYGEGLVSVLTDAFTELGGEVVAADAVNVGDTDFRGLLEDIAQEEPELVYFGGFPAEAARIAQQLPDAGLEDVIFMGADGIKTPEFIDLAGEAAEGVYASSSVAPTSDELDSFFERYEETYDTEPTGPFSPNAYDAVNMFLDAIEAVGEVDEDGNLVIDRAALSEYIRSIQDFQGLMGVLNCDGTGECSVADIEFVHVENGEFVTDAVVSPTTEEE
jgi:branched-chain amino acid transport system substrate-binding protein